MEQLKIEDINECDTDFVFEPMQRTRSNTWPLPQPEGYVEAQLENLDAIATEIFDKLKPTLKFEPISVKTNPVVKPSTLKKKSSRYICGAYSYAELITQAITSAKDARLTLSEIYNWMLENVPAIKNKGDISSNAGWKNSIRHNLSLHSRFVRIPNTGTGKSSWWTVNLNENVERRKRKRAASMDASKYEKSNAQGRKEAPKALRKKNLQIQKIPKCSVINEENVIPAINVTPKTAPECDSTDLTYISSNVNTEVIDAYNNLDNYYESNSYQEQFSDNIDIDIQQAAFQPRAVSYISSFDTLSSMPTVSVEFEQAPDIFFNSTEEIIIGLQNTVKFEPTYQINTFVQNISHDNNPQDDTMQTTQPMIRNNSLLDDINEILQKELMS